MGTLEWGAVDRAVEAGYVATRSKLEPLEPSILLTTGRTPAETAYAWTASHVPAT
jgi:hypothetical protein